MWVHGRVEAEHPLHAGPPLRNEEQSFIQFFQTFIRIWRRTQGIQGRRAVFHRIFYEIGNRLIKHSVLVLSFLCNTFKELMLSKLFKVHIYA